MAKDCVAMILAGGQGSRLGALTKGIAKPAVPFGGKYRIIDFALSNCVHSGIHTVGVLTQYQPLELNTYIGSGATWDLDRNDGGVYVLPPYVKAEKGEWYKGTANAIYQNTGFIEQFHPKYVVILSGDHVYKMDYRQMLQKHIETGSVATIAVMPVPMEEACRFGIMETDANGAIVAFEEKPKEPVSNLASMGIYVFDWAKLKKYLIMDENNESSEHDFGKNVIPQMLQAGEKMTAYAFSDYWKDVGTLKSLWDANMDVVHGTFDLRDKAWKIYSKNPVKPAHYVAKKAQVQNSCVTEGCEIYGTVSNSMVFEGVWIGEDAVVTDSVIMPNARVEAGAVIQNAVVGSNAVIGEKAKIGLKRADNNPFASEICQGGLTLIGEAVTIEGGVIIPLGSMVETDVLQTKSMFQSEASKRAIKNIG